MPQGTVITRHSATGWRLLCISLHLNGGLEEYMQRLIYTNRFYARDSMQKK